jgi:hypothetical protein
MVPKTSQDSNTTAEWTGPRLSHPEFAERLIRRRSALDNPVLPRNSGHNRTASKAALLKAIEDAGGKW